MPVKKIKSVIQFGGKTARYLVANILDIIRGGEYAERQTERIKKTPEGQQFLGEFEKTLFGKIEKWGQKYKKWK